MKKALFFTLLFVASFVSFAQERPEGLFINSKAPEFKAIDQSGAEVTLKDLRKKGPIVLVFYRGNWCPYCNKELKRFQDSLQLITDKGVQVVAVTPEGAEGIAKTVDKTGVTFPILYDSEVKIARSYQVAYEVDDKTATRYKSFGNDLLVLNQQKGKPYLPVPAVYIINKEGSVIYRYFEADYRKRVSVKEILDQLK
jgi:peroxiredoxin